MPSARTPSSPEALRTGLSADSGTCPRTAITGCPTTAISSQNAFRTRTTRTNSLPGVARVRFPKATLVTGGVGWLSQAGRRTIERCVGRCHRRRTRSETATSGAIIGRATLRVGARDRPVTDVIGCTSSAGYERVGLTMAVSDIGCSNGFDSWHLHERRERQDGPLWGGGGKV